MRELIQGQQRNRRTIAQSRAGTTELPGEMWFSCTGETWAYASATTFTIAEDLSDKYQAGDFVRFKQGGGYLYGCVTGVSVVDDVTTVTISGDVIADGDITDNYYSKALNPQGANLADFDADQFGSGAAADGDILAADGAGGAAWGANVPDHLHIAVAGQGGKLEATDALEATGQAGDLYLKADGSDGVVWAPLAAAVLDYDEVAASAETTTTSTTLVDLNSMALTVTVPGNGLVMLFGRAAVSQNTGYAAVTIQITDGDNVPLGMAGWYSHVSGTTLFAMAYKAVAAGNHTFKIRWMVSSGMGYAYARSLTAVVYSR